MVIKEKEKKKKKAKFAKFLLIFARSSDPSFKAA